MNEVKTVLFYVVGAVLLIVATMLFKVDPDSELATSFVITSTPAPTTIPAPTTTPLPPTRVRIEAGPQGCITTPFGGGDGYRPDAPLTTKLAPEGVAGERLVVSGTVYAADCQTPLSGVLLEVWHVDPVGRYNTTNFRARVITDQVGHYEFITIKPPRFVDFNFYVPAKIHYRVSYPNAPTLVTELFFAGDPILYNASSAQLRLVRPLTSETGPEGRELRTTFDISLAVDPPGAG